MIYLHLKHLGLPFSDLDTRGYGSPKLTKFKIRDPQVQDQQNQVICETPTAPPMSLWVHPHTIISHHNFTTE